MPPSESASPVPESAPAAPRRRGRPTTRRDLLLDTALRLFERDGFHAVGIDRILAEAGVAKMTLYKHFPSKQALIEAALVRRDERFFTLLAAELTARAPSARERLIVVFDVLGEWHAGEAFPGEEFHGCPFIKAAGEYPELTHPIHLVAADHKRRMLTLLTDLATEAGAPSPRLLGQRLLLLIEGATALAQVLGGREAARQARDTAVLLLRQMLGAGLVSGGRG